MIRVFVDANVIVSVLNKEYPLFTYSSRVLSLSNREGFELYTSSLCLAIGFYFSSKKSGRKVAKSKIQLLSNHFNITPINKEAIQKALDNPSVNDLEDGFQNYAAANAGCAYIITENVSDFYFSDLAVMNSQQFLTQCVFKQ